MSEAPASARSLEISRGLAAGRHARAAQASDLPPPRLDLMGATIPQRRAMTCAADDLHLLERAAPGRADRGWRRAPFLGRMPGGCRGICTLTPADARLAYVGGLPLDNQAHVPKHAPDCQ